MSWSRLHTNMILLLVYFFKYWYVSLLLFVINLQSSKIKVIVAEGSSFQISAYSLCFSSSSASNNILVHCWMKILHKLFISFSVSYFSFPCYFRIVIGWSCCVVFSPKYSWHIVQFCFLEFAPPIAILILRPIPIQLI